MNTTSSAGIWFALAGILVLTLGFLGVPITNSQGATVIADIVTIIGTIHGLIAHTNLVSGRSA